MNEGKTTAIFAVVAAVAFGLALWSKPGAISDEREILETTVGEALFKNFEDPTSAAAFEIVKFDESLGQLEQFEIAKDSSSDMWKLPSYDDYPADAAEQVRDAITPLVSLQILSVASPDRGDHSLYGVVNPDDEELSVAESGVGMLVRVTDNEKNVMASLIIGREVDDAENQRYVRIPTEDATYVVEIDTTAFDTSFQKWINSKLLAVRGFDITTVGLRDYAVLPMQGGRYGMSRNFDADLSFDATANDWRLDRFVTYDGITPVEAALAEGEELQDSALNDLRNAVQDLEIVSVRRKPNGLAADLKADASLVEDEKSLESLMQQGFFPQQTADGFELYATGGETLVGTDEGVQYVLRFGEAYSTLSTETQDEEDTGLRRYLLVTAKLDDSKFPAPDLQVQPQTVEDMLRMERGESEEPPPAIESALPELSDEDAGTTETGTLETPAAGEMPVGNNPAEEKPPAPEPKNSADDEAASDTPKADEPPGEAASTSQEPSAEDPAGDESLDDCGPQESDSSIELNPSSGQDSETAGDQDGTVEAAADSDTAATETATEPQPPAAGETQEELAERLEFTREQINKENQRLIDDVNESKDKARRKVQELNARFADWYYIVSDNVYKKLKVSKDQLIKSPGEDAQGNPQLPSGLPGMGQGGIPGLPPGFGQQP